MAHDKRDVQAVIDELSPEAVELLRRVLQLEKEKLHNRAADVTDDIVRVVKGLIS